MNTVSPYSRATLYWNSHLWFCSLVGKSWFKIKFQVRKKKKIIKNCKSITFRDFFLSAMMSSPEIVKNKDQSIFSIPKGIINCNVLFSRRCLIDSVLPYKAYIRKMSAVHWKKLYVPLLRKRSKTHSISGVEN